MKAQPTPEHIDKAKALSSRYKVPREELLSYFELERIPRGTGHSVKHLLSLLDEREDLNRIVQLLEIYSKSFPNSKSLDLCGFYGWYKKFWFSREDALVFKVYENVLLEFTKEKVNAFSFRETGEALIHKLAEWATDSSSETSIELLTIYFYLVIPPVQKFNPYLIVKPTSILSSYGWHTFLSEVDKKYSDKWQILTFSEATKNRLEEESIKLVFLHRIRQALLDEGDLEKYDTLGKQIARLGELAVFEKYSIEYNKEIMK